MLGKLVGHISRDSTAIEVREKPAKKPVTISVSVKRGVPSAVKLGLSNKHALRNKWQAWRWLRWSWTYNSL
jgi:hypothetical protein